MRSLPWPLAWGLLVLVWGSSFLFMKVGLEAFAPIQISTLRVLSGAAVIALLLRPTRTVLPRERSTWLHMQVAAFFLATAPFTLFAIGETRVPSALAGIGNAVTPIVTVVLALIFARGDEQLSWLRLLGVALGFVGVVVIMAPWSLTERPDMLGFAITLVAGSSYGVGWTWHRLHIAPRGLRGLAGPATQLFSAAPQLLLVLLLWWVTSGRPAPWSTHSASVGWPLAAVLALGVLGTGLAFALQFEVVREAGPTMATSVTYLIPVVSVLLGVLVLGETLSHWALLGFAVVLVGAVLVGFGNRWAAALRAR